MSNTPCQHRRLSPPNRGGNVVCPDCYVVFRLQTLGPVSWIPREAEHACPACGREYCDGELEADQERRESLRRLMARFASDK